jgi:hypothetical protein
MTDFDRLGIRITQEAAGIDLQKIKKRGTHNLSAALEM